MHTVNRAFRAKVSKICYNLFRNSGNGLGNGIDIRRELSWAEAEDIPAAITAATIQAAIHIIHHTVRQAVTVRAEGAIILPAVTADRTTLRAARIMTMTAEEDPDAVLDAEQYSRSFSSSS